jgi:hypothetical protein
MSFTLFAELLPELQEEVARHVTMLGDRVLLARTSHFLYQCIAPSLPKLPDEWRLAWDDVKSHPQVGEARRAFREMVALGVPQWPGAFHRGSMYVVPPENHCLKWTWTGVGVKEFLIFNMATGRWDISTNFYWHDDQDQFDTLGDMRNEDVAALRAFVGATWRLSDKI